MQRPLSLLVGPALATPLLMLVLLLPIFSSAAYPQNPVPAGTPPTLPPGPLLKPLPDNIRWTLTTTNNATEPPKPTEKPRRGKGSDSAKSPKPDLKEKADLTVVGEVTGKTSHVLDVAANGTKREEWTDGNLTAIRNSGTPELSFVTNSAEKMPTPSWITRANCVEIKTEAQKRYFVFRDRILPAGTEIVRDMQNPDEYGDDELKVEARAVIDAGTRLPVEVSEGEKTTSYKFEPLVPGTQIIPADIQAALAERGKEVQDSVRKPVLP